MQNRRHFLKTGFSIATAGLAGAAALTRARRSLADEAPPETTSVRLLYWKDGAGPGGSSYRLGDLGQAAEGLAIPSEALFQDHDPLEPALPFAHEQRAGLQTHALARLRRAAVERSADAILFPRRILRTDLSRPPNASDWSR